MRPMRQAGDESGTDAGWRTAAVVIVAVFIVTRVVTIAIAALVDTSIPLLARGPTFSTVPILSSLTGTDAVWYLGIAANGYHANPVHGPFLDWAFFPGYPIATRAISLFTFGDLAVAGLFVANASLLGACFVLYDLGRRYLGHERSLVAVTYVLIAPGAVAFGMAYSDSLFLLASACAFLAAERSNWRIAGILYGVAALTRLPGVALGVPLLVLWWTRPPRARSHLGWLLLGPLGLAAFAAFLGISFGDPLGFIHAQAAWNAPPSSPDSGALPGGIAAVVAVLISVRLIYVFLLVYFRHDRMPPAYGVLAVTVLAVTVGSLRIVSAARWLAVAWPFSWTLARRGPWVRLGWPALSGALFAVFAFLHFTQVVAP